MYFIHVRVMETDIYICIVSVNCNVQQQQNERECNYKAYHSLARDHYRRVKFRLSDRLYMYKAVIFFLPGSGRTE